MSFLVKVFQLSIYWPIYLFLKLIFKLEVEGIDNLKEIENKNAIFASNHAHWLDPVIGGYSLPRQFLLPYKYSPLYFICAKEYFNFFKSPVPFPISLIVALYVRINGSVPVDRDNKLPLEEKLKEAIKVLKLGHKLWIFPEGKISKDGTLQKGKRGVGFLHKATGVPIVPVALVNTFQCTNIKNLIQFILGKKRIKVVFGKPLYNLQNLEIEEIVNKVMKEIENLILK